MRSDMTNYTSMTYHDSDEMPVFVFERAGAHKHVLVGGEELLNVHGVHGHRVPDELQVRRAPGGVQRQRILENKKTKEGKNNI